MNWLEKVGAVILKIVGIETGLMPLINQAVAQAAPSAAPLVDKLEAGFNTVATAQQMFNAAYGAGALGSDKLKAATPYIAGLVQNLPLFTGKKPKDEAAFAAHCAAMTSSMADIFADFGD